MEGDGKYQEVVEGNSYVEEDYGGGEYLQDGVALICVERRAYVAEEFEDENW